MVRWGDDEGIDVGDENGKGLGIGVGVMGSGGEWRSRDGVKLVLIDSDDDEEWWSLVEERY